MRVLGAALLILGCSDPAAPRPPGHLEIVQAPPSAGVPGVALLDTLRVRVVDDHGKPQRGRLLTWTVRSGGGTIFPLEDRTQADGTVGAIWVLGSQSGINQVEVQSRDDSVLFQVDGHAFRVEKLDSNYGLGCGLVQGDLWCWGQNSWATSDPVSEGPLPFGAFPGPGVVAQGFGLTNLAVGSGSVCGFGSAGSVRCFASPFRTFVELPQVPAMRQIAGSEANTFCGLATSDSTAWCWDIETGIGAAVPGSPAFVDLEMDQNSQNLIACGRLVDSTAACWGDGPLGDGTFNPSPTPVALSGGRKYVELAVGRNFGCGLQASGDVWCWGRNENSQLGAMGPDSPVPVFAAASVSRISAAIQTVMVSQLGVVKRWGLLGEGGFGSPITTLESVAGLPVMEFSANDLSCLRLVDGQVYCFEELDVASSTLDIDEYRPVQPVP